MEQLRGHWRDQVDRFSKNIESLEKGGVLWMRDQASTDHVIREIKRARSIVENLLERFT